MRSDKGFDGKTHRPGRPRVTVQYDRFSFTEDQARQLARELAGLGFITETELELRGGGTGLIQEVLQIIVDSTWKIFAELALEEAFRHVLFKVLRKPDHAVISVKTAQDDRVAMIRIPSTERELARAFDLLRRLSDITEHHDVLNDVNKERVTLVYEGGKWEVIDADTGETWRYESDSLVLQPTESSENHTA